MTVAPKKAPARKAASKAEATPTAAKKSAPAKAEPEAVIEAAAEPVVNTAQEAPAEKAQSTDDAASTPAPFPTLFPAPFLGLFPNADASGFDLTDAGRELAEHSLKSVREMADAARCSMIEQGEALGESASLATENARHLRQMMLDASSANVTSGFAFLGDLFAAKSISDVMELQSGFFAKQVDVMTGQGHAFQEALTKSYEETTAPVRNAAGKLMEKNKAA